MQEIVENRRVIVQLKARSRRGNMVAREVVEDVLPDLYLAVIETPRRSEYPACHRGSNRTVATGPLVLPIAQRPSLAGR